MVATLYLNLLLANNDGGDVPTLRCTGGMGGGGAFVGNGLRLASPMLVGLMVNCAAAAADAAALSSTGFVGGVAVVVVVDMGGMACSMKGCCKSFKSFRLNFFAMLVRQQLRLFPIAIITPWQRLLCRRWHLYYTPPTIVLAAIARSNKEIAIMIG